MLARVPIDIVFCGYAYRAYVLAQCSHDVGVVGAGETPVTRNHDSHGVLDRAGSKQGEPTHFRRRAQALKQRVRGLGIGLRGAGSHLHAAQLTGSNQLLGLGDLVDSLDRTDSSTNYGEACHGLLLPVLLVSRGHVLGFFHDSFNILLLRLGAGVQ